MSRFSKGLGRFLGRMLRDLTGNAMRECQAPSPAEAEVALKRICDVEVTLNIQEMEIDALRSGLADVRTALHSQQEKLAALLAMEKTAAESTLH